MIQKIFSTILGTVIFIVLTLYLFRLANTVPFDGDEISWFFHTKFYEQLFLKRNFDQKFWSSYESFDHPQLSKYIFGAYLHVLNPNIFKERDQLVQKYGRWDFYFKSEISDIRVTEFARYIIQMRHVSILFTVGTLILLFFIMSKFFRFWPLSLFLSSVLVINPLFTQTMIRATSDAQVIFFVIATVTILVSILYQEKNLALLLTGITIGCAVATKLTGIIVGYSVILYEFFLIQQWGFRKMIKRIVIIVTLSFLIWYATNPGIYSSPIGSSWNYLQFRTDQSIRLANFFPEVKLGTIQSRIRATYCELINPACSKFKGTVTPYKTINIILLLLGIIALKNQGKTVKFQALSVTIFAITTVILNTVILPLYSDRYFLLPLVSVYLIDAIGINWIVIGMFSFLSKKVVLRNSVSV